MWCAISRFFNKQNTKLDTSNEEAIMDKGEGKKGQEYETETHANRQVSKFTISVLFSAL